MSDYLSFRLRDDFVSRYARKKVNWGYDAGGGNSLGEIIFYTKYSRIKPDGRKERWHETCRRVIEGTYSILKEYCARKGTRWNDQKAMRSAEEAYASMFNFLWLPPGRGLWMMGTPLVNEEWNAAPLYNCAFISTEKLTHHSAYEATLPFVRLMEMSMYGIGVGFDTRGAGRLTLENPTNEEITYRVEDSREGWCESYGVLLESYFFKNRPRVKMIYDDIREKGTPLKRFGGTAAGPQPLIDLHESVRRMFDGRAGTTISDIDILDLNNLSGRAVVAGGIRRTAEIGLFQIDQKSALDAKNPMVFPERMGIVVDDEGQIVRKDGEPVYSDEGGWGDLSNNSVIAHVGDDLDFICDRIAINGEPGIFYEDLSQNYGRMIDGYQDGLDGLVRGVNPCGEISLESHELCNLVETFPNAHDSRADYLRTLKFAYLYAKTVTLLPTPWPETNEVIIRNSRIGTSMSGVASFVEERGWQEMRMWADAGYQEIKSRDKQYSRWLGTRESIKEATAKPSGTVSILPGHRPSPGVNYHEYSGPFMRTVRFRPDDPFVEVAREAGYRIEPDIMDPNNRVVIYFPVLGADIRNTRQVPLWEKVALAALIQEWWADNSVSATFTFNKETEADQLSSVIRAFEGRLKTLSFLPYTDGTTPYKQMPYQEIDAEEREKQAQDIKALDWKKLYNTADAKEAEGEKFCTTDKCEISFGA